MPVFIKTLEDLAPALGALHGDVLVAGDVEVRRHAEVIDVTVELPGTMSDLELADANQRLDIPGLHRGDDGHVVYLIRIWQNHDGTIDASVVARAVAMAREVRHAR